MDDIALKVAMFMITEAASGGVMNDNRYHYLRIQHYSILKLLNLYSELYYLISH